MTNPKRLRIIKPSTLAFIREARKTPGFTLVDFLHGYFYARWPYLYIGVGTGTHPLARLFSPMIARIARLASVIQRAFRRNMEHSKGLTLADTYHGKVLQHESARQLISVREEIRLRDLEKVIPYPRARDLILKNPEKIAVLECPCRAGRDHPCLPLDVCLIVGEPFASFVIEHHPGRARQISQTEALSILEEEHERGHVHHAFFKDAMLQRYYAICNCCSCCCGAMQAHQHGSQMLTSSGYVARINEQECILCGECAESCPFGAIHADGTISIDPAVCMGCGVCASRCVQDAISLERAPEKGEPLEILRLLQEAGG